MEKPATILIVDDNQVNRKILQDLITVLGHKPILAEDGAAALDRIYQKPHPDLVLLDIMMPRLDGYEVLDKVKKDKFLRLLPIIMITAVDDIESQIRCIEKGADDYIIKPFNSILLKARINALLEKKRLYEKEQQFNLWLAESYQQLQKAQAARDSLFHMIVHDLNNPICIVLNQAQMLQVLREQDCTLEKISSFADVLVHAARQMQHLTQHILDVASLENNNMPVHLEDFDLGALLEELASSVPQLQDQEGQLHLDYQNQLYVHGDRILLMRVLQNLLTNAIKFIVPPTLPRITIVATRTNNHVRIKVTDNGPGINPEDQQYIFQRFFRSDDPEKKKVKGLGLGLTFCKLAVEAMNGSITVQSMPGQGTTFSIDLPAAGADA